MGTSVRVLPMSDDPVRTMVDTDIGRIPFQEYFVRLGCSPKVRGFEFEGIDNAVFNPLASESLKAQDLKAVIICPSNPYLSVDPILSINEIKTFLVETDIPILAISPIIANDSIKGPTSKIMREMKINPSVASIAQHYSELIDVLVIDHKDANCQPMTDSMTFIVDSIYMSNSEEKISLATNCLEKIKELA